MDTTNTKLPTLYTTPEEFHEALTDADVWHRLYTAVHASNPRLNARAHHDTIDDQPVTGIAVQEDRRTHQHKVSGSVLISTDGVLIIRAHTIKGTLWYTALDQLGTVGAVDDEGDTPSTALAWTWKPGPRTEPGVTVGTLRLNAHTRAEAVIERSKGTAEYANALLALIPTDRAACPATWRLATDVFHVLATGTAPVTAR
ncbi:hypothetical protein ABZ864_40830 [Streptomyces sp. NPDC047082]|uniref:hypothetical protein n=1 Tax=Streptomyces sp. NPDC047082 TaxID=3155259 RepID=UPI0033C10A60